MALRITVVHSPAPREVREWCLDMEEGSTVGEALERCGLFDAFLALAGDAALLSVWGRRCGAGEPLRDGDRVEVCRPLQVDPKVARRTRFMQQGARATGLFARRRAGGKAGY